MQAHACLRMSLGVVKSLGSASPSFIGSFGRANK